jgi:hemerythrin-like domain-containing protein
MTISLGAKGQADFTRPIELMMDCHRRIEHFLGVLRIVADRCCDGVLDPEARRALETALNYFHYAAPRHTADEEHSLFPRLRCSAGLAIRAAMVDLDQLESDHRQAAMVHSQVESIGRGWLAGGTLDPRRRLAFQSALAGLADTNARHIHLEDHSVFALASRVLDPVQLAEVGREMKARRAEVPGRDGSRCAKRRAATAADSEAAA